MNHDAKDDEPQKPIAPTPPNAPRANTCEESKRLHIIPPPLMPRAPVRPSLDYSDDDDSSDDEAHNVF